MIPFVRMFEYGNIAPVKAKIKQYFMDDGGTPGMLCLMDTNELWGTANDGRTVGLGVGKFYGNLYSCASAVEVFWGSSTATMYRSTDGNLYHTGRSDFYTGSTTYNSTFVDVSSYYSSFFSISDIKKVSIGLGTVLILLEDGRLFGHGTNSFGQLGLGHRNPQLQPILITDSVLDCWASGSNAFYRKSTFEIMGTGDNFYGIFGTNNVPVTTFTRILVAAGLNYDYNYLKVGTTNVILYTKGREFHCAGQNSLGSWGIGNTLVDSKTIYYKGTLPFDPDPDLYSFMGGSTTSLHSYWTTILRTKSGSYYLAGTEDGGGGGNNYNFFPMQYPDLGAAGTNVVCLTGTRSYTLYNYSTEVLYIRGSSNTSGAGAGYSPSTTPLNSKLYLVQDLVVWGK